MSDLPGRDDMFPFNAGRAFGVFSRDVAAGRQVHLVAGVFAPAIKLGGLRRVKLPGNFLGFVEGARGICLSNRGEKQQKQNKTTDTH